MANAIPAPHDHCIATRPSLALPCIQAQRERRSEAASDVAATRCGHLCEFETLSLLEPHKRYQNSVSIFQKRDGGWAEPLHTMYP